MSLWMVRGGRFGEQENLSFENGLACIGFHEVPDLSRATTKEEIFELVREAYKEKPEMAIHNLAGQLRTFAHRMKEGDLVAMPLKNRPQIAIGRVTGPYRYRTDLGDVHHTREVEWIKTDIQRTAFGQDLLYSLGAVMTVCQIERNEAEERVKAILAGKPDPGPSPGPFPPGGNDDGGDVLTDVEQFARDQILGHLEKNFRGHDLARLVDAVLKAEGYVTSLSPPGPDGGVDIMAGRGTLGLDRPRLCVQVKSTTIPADVNVFRGLQGSMATFQADQGLLVSWSGFTSAVPKEARLCFFSVRLWDSGDLVEAVLRNYDRLPEELQGELPLKRIWALVPEE
jgi:restriction system protein